MVEGSEVIQQEKGSICAMKGGSSYIMSQENIVIYMGY